MPRPKGSKNKKTLIRDAAIDNEIAELKKSIAPIEKEIKKLEAEIAAKQARYNEKRKVLRTTSRQLARKLKLKQSLDAEKAALGQKRELEQVVGALIDSGAESADIIAMVDKD